MRFSRVVNLSPAMDKVALYPVMRFILIFPLQTVIFIKVLSCFHIHLSTVLISRLFNVSAGLDTE